jgi:hypothetical protein
MAGAHLLERLTASDLPERRVGAFLRSHHALACGAAAVAAIVLVP